MVLPGESQKSLAWPKEKECRPEKIQRKKASQMQEPPKQRPCGSVCEQAILAGPNYWRKKVETHYGEV